MIMNEKIRLLINIIILTATIMCLDLTYLAFFLNKVNENVVNIQSRPLNIKKFTHYMTYLFLILGIVIFVFPTDVRKKGKEEDEKIDEKLITISWLELFIKSFIFGFLTYGFYNFTNYSFFSVYSFETALYNTFWGGIFISLSVLFTFLITSQI